MEPRPGTTGAAAVVAVAAAAGLAAWLLGSSAPAWLASLGRQRRAAFGLVCRAGAAAVGVAVGFG